MSVRDARTPPFIWVTIAALEHLRSEWDSKRAQVRRGAGFAVYHALCEIAYAEKVRGKVGTNSEGMRVSKSLVADIAGVSGKSIERACAELSRIGMLVIETDGEGANQPGRPSFYALIEPGQTYDRSSHVDRPKPTTEVRTSCDKGSDVDAEPTTEVRTIPNKEKKSNKKTEECAAPTADFSILPSAVAAPLRQIAEAKGGVIDAASIKRACDAFPDRDHGEEAERFAAWHGADGTGENARLRNVALSFRNWLKTAPTVEPGKRRKLEAVKPPTELTQIRERRAEAEAAWAAAMPVIRNEVPSFELWLEPLRPEGRDDSAIYLSAPDNVRTWVERRYLFLISQALEPHLGKLAVRLIARPESSDSRAVT